MSETIRAALIGAGATVIGIGAINIALFAYFFGGLNRTVSNHSSLFKLLPCLKPHCTLPEQMEGEN